MLRYGVLALVLVLALGVIPTPALAQDGEICGPFGCPDVFPPPIYIGTCYSSIYSTNSDVLYTGVVDTYNNAVDFASYDGSCTVELRGLTLVTATTQAEAVQKCWDAWPFRWFGMSMGADMFNWGFGYTGAPTDLWLCFAN